jgi:nitrate reductase NapE component
MTWFEIYALVWPAVAVCIVAAFCYFLVWLDDRAERRKAQRAAE